ncbi:MAG: hypothetical protein OXU20_41800 [Myxococcales bacterium]|nr:hypothetical protein [Myxococcales bacterium]
MSAVPMVRMLTCCGCLLGLVACAAETSGHETATDYATDRDDPAAAGSGVGVIVQNLDPQEELQAANLSFNLQYLMVQQRIQQQNRTYTALSNVLKTKHDTAKNSISNVR